MKKYDELSAKALDALAALYGIIEEIRRYAPTIRDVYYKGQENKDLEKIKRNSEILGRQLLTLVPVLKTCANSTIVSMLDDHAQQLIKSSKEKKPKRCADQWIQGAQGIIALGIMTREECSRSTNKKEK